MVVLAITHFLYIQFVTISSVPVVALHCRYHVFLETYRAVIYNNRSIHHTDMNVYFTCRY